jgi:hypothetical protein
MRITTCLRSAIVPVRCTAFVTEAAVAALAIPPSCVPATAIPAAAAPPRRNRRRVTAALNGARAR